MERKIQRADLALQLVYPDAAGIDIGNESHYVPVPLDGDNQSVRHTAELRTMADWLKQCGILTVAMQSTGVYWIPVFDLLGTGGFGSLPGERAGDEESVVAQKRCTKEPMADESAHLRAVPKFVPAIAAHPQDADVPAAAEGSDRATFLATGDCARGRPVTPHTQSDQAWFTGSIRYLLIFSISQSAICGIMTGQYSTAQCSPRPSNHRSPSFADW